MRAPKPIPDETPSSSSGFTQSRSAAITVSAACAGAARAQAAAHSASAAPERSARDVNEGAFEAIRGVTRFMRSCYTLSALNQVKHTIYPGPKLRDWALLAIAVAFVSGGFFILPKKPDVGIVTIA